MITVSRHRLPQMDAPLLAALTVLRDRQSRYDSPFFDLDFARVLSDVRDDTEILVVKDAGRASGYWALHVRPDGWCRPIGGSFSDWHGPVLDPVLGSLSAEQILCLAGLKGFSGSGFYVPGFAPVYGGTLDPAGIAHVPTTAEAYLANLKSLFPKHAKNLRRAERLIARDFGSMMITLDDASIEHFDWLMQTKRTQYERTGLHDVLKPDWVQAMMRTLHTKRYPRLRGRLSTLKFGNQLVAAEFNLLSDKIVHGWLTAYDQDYANYSPGHLLMRAVICGMEGDSQEFCDVGRGGHSYKKCYESFQVPCESASLRTGKDNRVFAGSWRIAETHMPSPVSGVMQRMRRRGDQIFLTDLDRPERAKGLLSAIARRQENR